MKQHTHQLESGRMLKKWLKQYRVLITAVAVTGILFWFSLSFPLFSDPLSTAVYDRNGELLGARIASDGQWRFPGLDSVPEKYAASLLQFEDRYFYMHPGVNPVSLARAFIQNISSWEIKSGGSTITMQVIRMSRKNKPRTMVQKMIEIWLALRYELTASKEEIILTYTNHAPFGGNVVGLEAASWRYFGTSPYNLTWAESAMLAVLPNAPALIHPGRNREQLVNKRNRLLRSLMEADVIDSLTWQLAREEPLPEEPLPLPEAAPHLTDKIMLDEHTDRFNSTIDKSLQMRVNELARLRQEQLSANEIHNMACLVMEIESGNVRAYLGNTDFGNTPEHGNKVDVINARRSTGSILKPLLFAGILDNGDLLQTALVPDVPIRYNGYAPKNYDRGYEGAVPAYEALERSLNIPAVIMLKNYGIDQFLSLLRKLGFSTFNHSHEHYGLTLILGGAETSLWELSGVYASMARVLNNYTGTNGNYNISDYHMPVLNQENESRNPPYVHEEGILSASSIYHTFKSLLEVNRPEELSLWYLFSSSRKIAWKTGTSYGNRDAWAVGVTPGYLVAVWAGNADGEGRPGLTGVSAAAPLMFDIFSVLPETSWFEAPLDDLESAVICKKSGYLAGTFCAEKDTIRVVPKGKKSRSCPYHKLVHLDESMSFRVNSNCYRVADMKPVSWFILPPLMELYYKTKDPSYKMLPPVMDGCVDQSVREMQIVYPEYDSHLVIPIELDGTKGKVVMEVAHRNAGTEIFWHIDDEYVATTTDIHTLAVDIKPGRHQLTVVDENGNTEKVSFDVIR